MELPPAKTQFGSMRYGHFPRTRLRDLIRKYAAHRSNSLRILQRRTEETVLAVHGAAARSQSVDIRRTDCRTRSDNQRQVRFRSSFSTSVTNSMAGLKSGTDDNGRVRRRGPIKSYDSGKCRRNRRYNLKYITVQSSRTNDERAFSFFNNRPLRSNRRLACHFIHNPVIELRQSVSGFALSASLFTRFSHLGRTKVSLLNATSYQTY